MPEEGFSRELVKTTGKELSNAVDEGFGSIIQGIDYTAKDEMVRLILKQNVWKFSVAKNYNDCIAINNLLLKKDGSVRPWNEFKQMAMGIVGASNRYLKTEYDTIIAGAMMSRKWNDMQRDKHLFPFAKFVVTMDGKTSDTCKPLHGMVVGVDDPFLSYYFPPNHFNCRTDVIKLRDAQPTPQNQLPYIDIPKAFLNNAGDTGEIFTAENPYIKNTPKALTDNLGYYKDGEILVSNLAKKYTSSANEMIRGEREYQNRIDSAKALQKHFETLVTVLPEMKPSHWAYDIHFEGVPYANKVPDFKVGNEFWEMESYEGKLKKTKIGNMIKHGQEQADNIAIKLNKRINPNPVIKQIKELAKNPDFNFRAKRVAIISIENEVIAEITRPR